MKIIYSLSLLCRGPARSRATCKDATHSERFDQADQDGCPCGFPPSELVESAARPVTMAAATSVPPDLNLVLFSSDVYVLTLHTYMLTAAPGARWGGKGDLRGSEKETRLSIYSNIEDAGSRDFWTIERQASCSPSNHFVNLPKLDTEMMSKAI